MHRRVIFASDSILPDPPEDATAILHDREYRVRAFRLAPDRILIQGALRDQKPPRLYIPSDDEPLTVHHMQLSLEISFPDLEIMEVDTHFEDFPNASCSGIAPTYDGLLGVSIARGFTHKVRELFGGPRGCTHVTALLQAMAPIAMQCFHSMHAADAIEAGQHTGFPRIAHTDRLVNTCHVWAEGGEMLGSVAGGDDPPIPVFLTKRLDRLGIDADELLDG